MPPKKDKGGGGSSSKVQVDKTFGMKNKKGSKAQQVVKTIQQQQAQAGKSKQELALQKKREQEKKLKEEEAKRRLADPLFAIVQPKVPFGVDPKTITCAFWKAGKCDKGSKCKFAHSNDAARKVQKKDLYTDTRDEQAKDDKTNDTMDKWDQEKLDKVILSKHGNPKSTTDKVCKYFLQAVEDGKYGWFWECPNGGEKCMYKHRLPPGFVLKSQKKELEELEKANEITLEDFLETQRHKLGPNLTPVTAETFAKWKKERVDKKVAEEEMLKSKKAAQAQANKLAGLSGREMFSLNPDFYADEEDDEGDDGGEFDMAAYLSKGWTQERQSDDEGESGISEDEDYDEDDQEEEEKPKRPASTDKEGEASKNGDDSSSQDANDKELDAKLRAMSVNGDEGKEDGRRKE